MTRSEFAASLILDIGYNDISEKPKMAQIYADIDKYFPLILVQVANNFGESVLNNFNVTTIRPVKFDTGMGMYFLDMTGIVPMNLRGYAGIRQIGDTQNDTTDYVPLQRGWTSPISYLEVNGLAGRIGYWLQGNIPYIKNPPAIVPDKLRLTYVPTIMNLSETDQITCPAETLSMLSDKLRDVLEEQKNTNENVSNDIKNNQ